MYMPVNERESPQTCVVLCFAMKHFHPETSADPDDIRVRKFNEHLAARATTDSMAPKFVITASEHFNTQSDRHIDVNFKDTASMNKINKYCSLNNYIIVDVYLDYFFLIKSYYGSNYGTNWFEKLSRLEYIGNMYLPICRDNPPSRITKGKFITGSALSEDILAIGLCSASHACARHIAKLPGDFNSGRVHTFQYNTYIEGFLVITKQEACAAVSGSEDALLFPDDPRRYIGATNKIGDDGVEDGADTDSDWSPM